ncbi:NTR domain-containing protein-like [Ostrea edulis]|uniref:NTR domain-containing protein-like n=1 Tax=Ostrea edulis TaxID=37623 RepID=UPI0024AF9B5E|nr:NTR domain-containing protein-like [Ostrea edulis]
MALLFRRYLLTMERSIKLIFLAVGFLALCVGYVHACTCGPRSDNGCQSDYSLRGVVLTVQNLNGRDFYEKEYLVYVERYYKEIPLRQMYVRIRSARQSSLCGVQLQIGERYVISGSVDGPRLRTNLCVYTRTWDSIPDWQKQNLYCGPGALNLPLLAPST